MTEFTQAHIERERRNINHRPRPVKTGPITPPKTRNDNLCGLLTK
ncbi:hypothetical protein RSSM_00701 [Rhodopirellula sallentina SM41]|uniref:Uncharacterized protein n=1 Tax=Rhodopirellula sallentina SM41 TaxID=1263870 RepID=M5UPA0_9BACT|nr:hypothetical protein RSSM_00701 [Rhodopirellula sallentina SM41]